MSVTIHPTAEVAAAVQLGDGTRIWHQAQVREGAIVGSGCNIGKGVYADRGVTIGNNCKLQNGVYVYHGVTLEDGVFLGPGVMVLNDRVPRAINPDGTTKSDDDWDVSPVRVCNGASVGGGAVVLPGVTVGRWAMIGSGSVVAGDVPDHGLVYGNPASLHGYVCYCGQRLTQLVDDEMVLYRCVSCAALFRLQGNLLGPVS